LALVDSGRGSLTVQSPNFYPGRVFRWTAGKVHVTQEQTALGRVRALGFAAEDVRDVILTHLDIDHVGGLHDFPKAQVHVSRAEHLAAFSRRQPFRSWIHSARRAFDHKPRFSVAELADRNELGFPRSADLFGDGSITFLDASGHTPGHCAVMVRVGGRTVIHAGDAFVQASELGDGAISLGARLYGRVLHEDKPGALKTLERLRQIAAQRFDVTVVNAHDLSLLKKLPAFPEPFAS
jgi:glyoxylase-like metal-dependent hydrolase (beta-lactamase superfamily II)